MIKDYEKRKQYAREWIAERRHKWFSDKSCVRCGSQSDLELDHIDPSTKVTHAIWSWSEIRRNIEISKCQVLCNSCHKIKTNQDRNIITGHGTEHDYKLGCRCFFVQGILVRN